MATLIATYGFYFGQPWWLGALVLLVPIVWLASRNLASLGKVRRSLAIILRCLVVLILVLLLARVTFTRRNEKLTVIAVVDRSQSIPEELRKASIDYLDRALEYQPKGDKLAVVDIAENASISELPSDVNAVRRRNTTLTGRESKLADGIEMAMAIAPPDTAVRILLVSEGNETGGDLKEAARTAATNGIAVDVLPVRYKYKSEVVFRRLAAPIKARSNQTVSLRFVLESTAKISGKLMLTLNGKPVDLVPGSPEVAAAVQLESGTNVKTVSLPLGTRGMHEFKAVFIPDDPSRDRIVQNNVASAMTYVAGPGHVLVVDSDGTSGQMLNSVFENSEIEARYCHVSEMPQNLGKLVDTDAVILVNTPCSSFTFQQQEMITRYVTELGGGLIMIGGDKSFGAGGWIGSPVAEVLPVDLDPPQKKQMPKGGLVLIMHACEMPQGNYWGKQTALAAVKTLSRLDMVGVLDYGWQAGNSNWVYPFSQVGDKSAVSAAINKMQMGDMPDFRPHIQAAYNALTNSDAVQKHIIIISDGDPQMPTPQQLNQLVQAGITCSGVAVFPHSQNQVQSLYTIAQKTGGRFYNVADPLQLPQIFIKEAQVVRRALIMEETFTPTVTYSLGEITRGLSVPLPDLDGYVLTGSKGGLTQTILTSSQSDPILASCQAGLGRCVAFTSSIDSRWASNWLAWGGFERFWEQVIRWTAKPAQSNDCEVFADVEGRKVNINVEAVDSEGQFMQLTKIEGQVISPDISTDKLALEQVGPGQYRGQFQAGDSGSYIVNLRYKKFGQTDSRINIIQTTVNIPFAPEFRDLNDNFALMEQVSQISGGRILDSDPNYADMYSHAGIKFPETELPLTNYLLLIWLGVFLLDVAVRRVAVDFKAGGRAIASLFKRKRKVRDDSNIERLKLTRKKIADQLKSRSDKSVTSRRYETGADFSGDLPVAKTEPKPPPKKEPEKTRPTKAPADQTPSHIQQLLRAKRKAGDKGKDGNDHDN